MPGQGSDQEDGMSHLGFNIPTNWKEALFRIAQERSTRSDRVTMSDVARNIFGPALAEEVNDDDELPGEVRDLLDDDLIANAGGKK